MSLKCLFGKHEWALLDNQCIEKCTICGKEKTIEDEKHKWVLLKSKCAEKCSICNKERSIEHSWNENGRVCTQCGVERREIERNGNRFFIKCKKCGNDTWRGSEGFDESDGPTPDFITWCRKPVLKS